MTTKPGMIDKSDEGRQESVASGGVLHFISSHLDWRRQGVLLVLVVIAIIFNFTTHGIFLGPRNFSTLLRQASVVGVAACGMTLIIILGEIDLSIGSMVYFIGVMASAMNVWWKWSVPATLLGSLALGVAAGVWQGSWVARFSLPAFVVTLAGLMGFRGIGLIVSDANTIYPMADSYQSISEAFLAPPYSHVLIGALFLVSLVLLVRGYQNSRKFGIETSLGWTVIQIVVLGIVLAVFSFVTSKFEGIPTAVIVLFAVAAIMHFIMRNTVLGRNMYAIGSNKDAAALSGINIKRHIVYAFVIMGVIYFFSGTLMTARLSGSVSGTAQGMELDAIAAAVIGGTSLMGGVGSIPGTIAGALLLASVDNGMSLMNISTFYQLVVKAALLLFAVAFDVTTRRHSS